MPEQASEVFHRSQEGFGWWKAAEFTISEEDFRAYAAKKGWELLEEQDYPRYGPAQQMLWSEKREITDDDRAPIPRALVYERRRRNNGGLRVVFDPSTSRAYYHESHR